MSAINKELPSMTFKATEVEQVEFPKDLLGKVTVLYFYPKDDTPGCTKQACGYRDFQKELEGSKVQVFGVSMDDLGSHEDFKSKFSLNFPLIVDDTKALSEFLGVYGEQTWGDKKYMGLSRDSFLIDQKGVVVQEWRKVDPVASVDETLDAAKKLL